jgi:hypothetical protein
VAGAGRRLLLVPLICLAAALAGCGSSSSTSTGASAPTSAAKAHAFALANAACLEYNKFIEAERAHEGEGNPNAELAQFFARTEARLAKLRTAMSPIDGLPQAAKFIADMNAQGGSLTELSGQLKQSAAAYLKLTESEPFAENTRRYAADVAADAKALGLGACAGPRPRKGTTG